MTYTNLELLRKQLADPFKFATDKQTGDGKTLIFQLAHERIQNLTYDIFVGEDHQTITTEFTIDLERGIITFVTAPVANAEIRVNYYFAAFSDVELTEFLTLESNSVDKAMVRCINILLMDATRRFDYASGQTEIKASQVFSNLLKLREVFESKISAELSAELSASNGGVKIVNRIDSHYQNETIVPEDLSRLDTF